MSSKPTATAYFEKLWFNVSPVTAEGELGRSTAQEASAPNQALYPTRVAFPFRAAGMQDPAATES